MTVDEILAYNKQFKSKRVGGIYDTERQRQGGSTYDPDAISPCITLKADRYLIMVRQERKLLGQL